MTLTSALQYIAFIFLVTLSVKPVGSYMEKVFSGKHTALDWACLPIEKGLYRLTGVDPSLEMNWIEYACCFVLFSFAGTMLLYVVLRLQRFLPFFVADYQATSITPDLAMNTAV